DVHAIDEAAVRRAAVLDAKAPLRDLEGRVAPRDLRIVESNVAHVALPDEDRRRLVGFDRDPQPRIGPLDHDERERRDMGRPGVEARLKRGRRLLGARRLVGRHVRILSRREAVPRTSTRVSGPDGCLMRVRLPNLRTALDGYTRWIVDPVVPR